MFDKKIIYKTENKGGEVMKCNICGENLVLNKENNSLTCSNVICEMFIKSIPIEEYIFELKMNAYNTIEWYKAEVKLWKNKYNMLLESKVKEIKAKIIFTE
jgi:hypothetical protein